MRDERDEHLTRDDPWEIMRHDLMVEEREESRYGWERGSYLDRTGLKWAE